jgi:hypothetical protein
VRPNILHTLFPFEAEEGEAKTNDRDSKLEMRRGVERR